MAPAQLWWDIAQDPTRRDSDQLAASKLLAERGRGNVAFAAVEDEDPFDLANMEQAAEQFCRNVSRLAELHRRDADP
jgi:hypothetical protein